MQIAILTIVVQIKTVMFMNDYRFKSDYIICIFKKFTDFKIYN